MAGAYTSTTLSTSPNVTDMTWTPVVTVPLVPNYILILTVVSCLFSIFGCFAIFWTFFKFESVRTKSRQLLLFLTVADLFTAAGYLMGVIRYYLDYYSNDKTLIAECRNPGIVCKLQSWITTCSNLCSFFWMMVISFYFIVAIVRENVHAADKMVLPSHVISWGLPILLTSLGAAYDVLGEDLSYTSGGWCWVKECEITDDQKMLWMFVTGKFWEFLTYIVLIVNYLLLKYVVWSRMRYNTVLRRQNLVNIDNRQQLDRNDTMFIFVPFILLVLRIWGSLKFLITISLSLSVNDVGSEKLLNYPGVEVLTLMQGIGDSGQGFWNFILFCVLTTEVRQTIAASFKRRPLHHDSVTSHFSNKDNGSINEEKEPTVLSISPEDRDEYNKERTAILHKHFAQYDSASFDNPANRC